MSSGGPEHLAVWLISLASWPSSVRLHSPVLRAFLPLSITCEGGNGECDRLES